jgi:hypothetical protein
MATTGKNAQPWKDQGLTKQDWLAREVARAVNAGKTWSLETVNFDDPNRPQTCLEVDFPIIPINQVAAIEGNAGKPIYQMSKWWARRRSSVFRSMLLASAIKAPDDPAEAAKLVWDVYYGNHQATGAFKQLKVADIFMGGGTTVVEGSRLGMQMYGNDLNPVAWFVVKNELAKVEKAIASATEIAGMLHATDAGDDGVRKMAQVLSRRYGEAAARIPRVILFASSQMDLALGRANVIHAALKTGPAAEAFFSRARRLTLYRGVAEPARGAQCVQRRHDC